MAPLNVGEHRLYFKLLLWRKLISTARICDLILSVDTQSSGAEVKVATQIDGNREHLLLAQFLLHAFTPVHLMLHPPLTGEQHPETLELLCLGQGLPQGLLLEGGGLSPLTSREWA